MSRERDGAGRRHIRRGSRAAELLQRGAGVRAQRNWGRGPGIDESGRIEYSKKRVGILNKGFIFKTQ